MSRELTRETMRQYMQQGVHVNAQGSVSDFKFLLGPHFASVSEAQLQQTLNVI